MMNLKLHRNLPVAIVACAVCISGVAALAQPGSDGLSPILTNNPIYKRELWFWKQRAFPLPGIPDAARQNAVNKVQQIQSQTTRTKKGGPPPAPGNLWVNIGPTPILGGQVSPPQAVSGRTTAIAVDPSDPTHW